MLPSCTVPGVTQTAAVKHRQIIYVCVCTYIQKVLKTASFLAFHTICINIFAYRLIFGSIKSERLTLLNSAVDSCNS